MDVLVCGHVLNSDFLSLNLSVLVFSSIVVVFSSVRPFVLQLPPRTNARTHNSWLEVFEFENDALPYQLVVGNGGTLLIDNDDIPRDSLSKLDFHVGKPEYNITGKTKRGELKFEYGYAIMKRKEDGSSYDVNFYTWRKETGTAEPLDFTLSVPKGPRVTRNAPVSAATAVVDGLTIVVVVAIGFLSTVVI